jgi:hypothetical protein
MIPQTLLTIIQNIHVNCFTLCKYTIGTYLPIAGNIGIFCQSEDEFETFTKIQKEICEASDNSNQKYFILKNPITIEQTRDIPTTTYTHLYIRKPSPNSPERGDVDFVLGKTEYENLKQEVLNNPNNVPGASIYNRPGWDTIEIRDANISALAYVTTTEMAEKVRVRFD